ncbi:unnamed protein product [Anisakis simplex]|uniref:Uncharacterized protein n=1 Tax=Anisakis simplex TaxID=6269 RepID=A0A158PN81_ANISI|nr:unnamed protein product [Anisakis simplex]
MRLLAFCTLLLVVIGMAAIGLLRFRVFFGDQPSVDELLDLAIQAETLNLVQAQNHISFGGNKLELYEEESRTVRRVLQPAIAVLLIFLAYVLVGAVLLYLIVDPTNSLVTDIFANYFYVSTISSPQWIYLNNPDIWQLLFLVGNAFFGNILVCAANVNIASVTLYYLNAIISARSTKRQLQKENCSSLIHS